MAGDNDKTQVSNTQSEKASERRKIGHYEIVAELGRGGMGTVYRAYEQSLNRYVAIKVLAPHLADDQELVLRFAREAKSVAALNHPNIVHIYYTGDDNGLPYFVMECIEGDTITDMLAERGVFSPHNAAEMVLQAAKGLAAAHQSGIIHRDIKPSNLMVDASGTLKITDFGIALARDSGDNLTTTGNFVGTTGYVSPEIFKGHTVDARSDIFSLGVVLFEMLAGRKPFDDDSPMGQMLQVVEHPAPSIHDINPAVDAALQKILARMIAKEPTARYQSCDELADDLRLYLAGAQPTNTASPVSSVNTGSPPPADIKAPPRRRGGWAVLLLLLLTVGAAGYWWRAPLSDTFNNALSKPSPAAEPAETTDATETATALAATGAAEPTKAAQESTTAEVTESTETPQTSTEATDNTAVTKKIETAKMAENQAALNTTKASETAEPQLTGTQNPTAKTSYTATPAASTPTTADDRATATVPAVAPTGVVPAAGAPTGVVPATNATPTGALGSAVAAPQATVSKAAPTPSNKKPAAITPTDTVVIVRGDPVLATELRQMLNQSARNNRLKLLDGAFIPGLGGSTSAPLPALADVREPIMKAGGRFLVIVNAVTLDSESLDYYGQRDTLYTAQINLTGYDLIERSQLGNWGESVRYTNLNAKTKTNAAAQAMVDELTRSIMDAAR